MRPAKTLPSPASKNGSRTSLRIRGADSWPGRGASSSVIRGRVSLTGHGGAPVDCVQQNDVIFTTTVLRDVTIYTRVPSGVLLKMEVGICKRARQRD